jgi:hypothetical protein
MQNKKRTKIALIAMVVVVTLAGSAKAVDLCTMPVYTTVGDMTKTCYMDCESVKVTANFDAQLNLKKDETGNALKARNWDTYFYYGTGVVPGDGAWYELKICAKASKINKVKGPIGTKVEIGTVTIACEVPDGGFIEVKDCEHLKLDLIPVDCGYIGLEATQRSEDIHKADFNDLVILTEKWLEKYPGVGD